MAATGSKEFLDLLYSKWLRKDYPVVESASVSDRPVLARILRSLLWVDQRVPFPIGTSLLMKGTRK